MLKISSQLSYMKKDVSKGSDLKFLLFLDSGVEYIYVIASGCIDIFTITWSVILLLATFRSTRRNWALGTVSTRYTT